MKKEKPAYPPEEWTITEESTCEADLKRNGTIFFLGNGYLGIRAGLEEYGFDDSPVHKGTYINGFFETEPIIYGEAAYGFAREKQVILNLADATEIRLDVRDPSGEEYTFSLGEGTVVSSERFLDLKKGILVRRIAWISPSGIPLDIEITRMVSLSHERLACIVYRVRTDRKDMRFFFHSVLNGEVFNARSDDDPRVGSGLPEDTLTTCLVNSNGLAAELEQETAHSHLLYACRTDHRVISGILAGSRTEKGRNRVVHHLDIVPGPDGEVVLEKYMGYASSREFPAEQLREVLRGDAAQAIQLGAGGLSEKHRQVLDSFWDRADIRIDGDLFLQQGLRYNLFALLQSAGKDGIRSIAAKGLSGEGYEGHYFWDTEIYVLPFFVYTFPETAKALLHYRYSILDKARERARVLSERGALFPWRTIAGEEASAYFPAGTAQYHINADIVYGLEKYFRATRDEGFLVDYGAEIAFETARLWMSLGDFIERKGRRFCLNGVTGPDEYTAIVNNNTYTNIMARGNLAFALEAANILKEKYPERFADLCRRLSLEDREFGDWSRAAGAMYIPYDRDRGIHPQDDSFFDKEVWDFDGTPEDAYPLLLHYHPLVIYRHQVLKQPDVVLAQFLKGEVFSRAEKRRNFLFYDPLTTGDSSLSPCVQSVAASEIGNTELAYRYFMKTARMDLDDVNRNVRDGIHTAAMAGTWISLVYGFGGMREIDGRLTFDPRMPRHWHRLEFRILFRNCHLMVSLSRNEVSYTLKDGDGLRFMHRGSEVMLCMGETKTFSLIPRLEAVLFDLDGVVTDTAELHFRAWKRLSDEIGLPFDRDVNENLRGIGRRESFMIILEHGNTCMSDREIDLYIERKNEYYRESLQEITPKDILPGIDTFLSDLRSRGIKTAIVSASRNASFILEKLGLIDAFDAVVDPAAAVMGKPDPELFFLAADMLRVPCENCVGIEDAAAGIEAIRAAGMFSVGIGPAASEADVPLKDTGDLSSDQLEGALGEFFRGNEAEG